MKALKLTKNNYYSVEANNEYASSSLVKQMLNCEERAIAEFSGKWDSGESKSLLIGSFVDAAFEGPKSLEKFKAENKSIFNSRTGELKSEFKQAEKMVTRARQDALFMDYMKGQKQKIFTGTIEGVKFKCKLDVYRKGERIVDLKTTADFEKKYKEGYGKVEWFEYWEYPIQLAIYQELVRQNTGDKLPCYIAAITKQDDPDIDIIQLDQAVLDAQMEFLKHMLPRLDAIRTGIVEPARCGKCVYCRQTKVLKAPTIFNPFMEEFT